MSDIEIRTDTGEIVLWHMASDPHAERAGLLMDAAEAREKGKALIAAADEIVEAQDRTDD